MCSDQRCVLGGGRDSLHVRIFAHRLRAAVGMTGARLARAARLASRRHEPDAPPSQRGGAPGAMRIVVVPAYGEPDEAKIRQMVRERLGPMELQLDCVEAISTWQGAP